MKHFILTWQVPSDELPNNELLFLLLCTEYKPSPLHRTGVFGSTLIRVVGSTSPLHLKRNSAGHDYVAASARHS